MKNKSESFGELEEKSKWNHLPGLSIFGAMLGILVMIISFLKWGGVPPIDISQLIFGLGFGLSILFVSYYYWTKKMDDIGILEMQKDIQAIDKKCNDLENHIIKLNSKIK